MLIRVVFYYYIQTKEIILDLKRDVMRVLHDCCAIL